MTAAVDKRDYLVNLGLAKPGRGRFGREALDALAEAEKNGVVFVDKKAIVTTVRVADDKGNVTEEKRSYDPFAPHSPAIRTGLLTFVGQGKARERTTMKVNATEACIHCQMSFGWCYCELPQFRFWKTGEVLTLSV